MEPKNSRVAALTKILRITQEGYAGMMPDTGMIVDRREHPEAIPIKKNTSMGIPEPKPVINPKTQIK